MNAKHRQQKTKEVLYAEYLGPNAANAKKKKGRAIYAKDNNKIGSKFLEETFMLNVYYISISFHSLVIRDQQKPICRIG